jgi:hypothetical protein
MQELCARRKHALLLCALLLALSASAAPAAVPLRVESIYRVSMGSLKIGEGRDVLQHDGKTYKVASESKTVGLAAIYRLKLSRQSAGRVTSEGLRPDSFAELRNGKPKRSVRFDWAKKQALLIDGEKQQVVPLPDDTWDQMSFAYNFAFAGLKTAALAAHLTDGRRIKRYEYTVVGEEPLRTELGSLKTIRIGKVQPPGDKRGFEVWISPAHHNLPVRMRFTEKNGTVFDSVISRISYSTEQ